MRGRNLNCRALQPSRAQKCWQSVWGAAAVGVVTTGFLRVRDTVFINSVNGLLLALLHYLSPLALADSFAGRPCSGGTVQCQLSELNAGNRDSGGGGGLCERTPAGIITVFALSHPITPIESDQSERWESISQLLTAQVLVLFRFCFLFLLYQSKS